MDARFLAHNCHLGGAAAFRDRDPNLRRLASQPLVWRSPLLDVLPAEVPGVYSLGGGRQIGKTTLLKQWMLSLVERGVDPQRMVFLTGELIDDHHALVRLVQDWLEAAPATGPLLVLIDEVTYISGWDRAVKFLADAGSLESTVVVLTGSDLAMVKAMRSTLPGRRGRSDVLDFHLHPLSYVETCRLKSSLPEADLARLEAGSLEALRETPTSGWDAAFGALEDYLVHGGYLTAINDLAAHGRVLPATLATYSDWIRGDMARRGKQEGYLREILTALLARAGGQVTWNALASELSIDHPQTVADYVHLLEAMDAFLVLPALLEDRLGPAPKKARKVLPVDPFIHHAVRHWLSPTRAPLEEEIRPFLADPARASALVECCVAGHARRRFSTFYLKGEGEVDVALVQGRRFWPIEVKWTSRVRPKDLKQIARYPNGVIASRVQGLRTSGATPVLPLPLVLARLAAGEWPPAGLAR